MFFFAPIKYLLGRQMSHYVSVFDSDCGQPALGHESYAKVPSSPLASHRGRCLATHAQSLVGSPFLYHPGTGLAPRGGSLDFSSDFRRPTVRRTMRSTAPTTSVTTPVTITAIFCFLVRAMGLYESRGLYYSTKLKKSTSNYQTPKISCCFFLSELGHRCLPFLLTSCSSS